MSGSSKLSRRGGRGQVLTTPDGGLYLKSNQHHPVEVATVAAHSSGDESPEPSPVAPPQPQQQQQQQQQQNMRQRTMVMPPWTPMHETPWKGGLDVEDDESLPSIPDNVPSPYSPPPASLFSGEEFPPKSIRKPKPSQEIRVQQQQHQQYANNTTTNTNTSASALTTTALHDLSLNHSHPQRYPYAPQLRLYGSGGSRYSPDSREEEQHPYYSQSEPPQQLQQERPQVLPSVLYLKKDLQESHQSLHLLQQENKALAAECDRFQLEVSKWRQQATQHEALQQHIQHLQHEMEQLRQETNHEIESIQHTAQQKVDEVSTQLVASQANNARLEAEMQKMHEQVELTESELRELKAQMKAQAQSAAQKLKSVQDERDTQLDALHDQRKSLELEIERLNAMLCEARQRESKVATTVQAEVDQVQLALEEAHDTIQELSDQKVVLESELTEKECTWRDEIDRLHRQLAETNDTLKELQETLAEATERENQLLVDKEALQNEITSKINEMQNDIDSLQQTLAQANAEKQALQTSLTQKTDALKESYTKYGTLRSEKETLQKEVYRARKSLQTQSSTTKSRVSAGGPEFSPQHQQALKDEVDRLQAALRQATAKCNALRGERATLTQKLAHAKHGRADGAQPSNAAVAMDETTGGEGDDDDLVPNRLGRIRDAAERAALVKEYRRELSRWKLEHDAELKRLTARHEQDLKDVFEEAKSEVSARARETRRRLQDEYETKVATLEQRTQAELSRMQRECDKNTAVAEEAMQAAASEVSTVTKQLDEVNAARESLEANVRELERKLVTERQKSQLSSSEWKSHRKQWQAETNNLIASIQQECNTVFAQNMVVARTQSPNSVTAADESSILAPDDDWGKLNSNHSGGLEAFSPVTPASWKKTTYKSPLDVSQALDETEAMVRSFLAGNQSQN